MTNQTPHPRSTWERLARIASNTELRTIIADCRDAMILTVTHDMGLENYYAEQADTYEYELSSRGAI